MRTRINRSYVCLLGLLVLALAAPRGAAQLAPAPSASVPYAGAEVMDWKGAVRIEPVTTARPLYRGQVLANGSTIVIDEGKLLLRLQDGSEVLLHPRTHVLITDPSTVPWLYFRLLVGRIRARVTRRTGGAAPFQLGTPSAVISVRGTDFEVEANPHSITEVDVISGVVEVKGLGPESASVLLEPGFSTRVGVDGRPEPPVRTEEIRPEVESKRREHEADFDHGKLDSTAESDADHHDGEHESNSERDHSPAGFDQEGGASDSQPAVEPENVEPPPLLTRSATSGRCHSMRRTLDARACSA